MKKFVLFALALNAISYTIDITGMEKKYKLVTYELTKKKSQQSFWEWVTLSSIDRITLCGVEATDDNQELSNNTAKAICNVVGKSNETLNSFCLYLIDPEEKKNNMKTTFDQLLYRENGVIILPIFCAIACVSSLIGFCDCKSGTDTMKFITQQQTDALIKAMATKVNNT